VIGNYDCIGGSGQDASMLDIAVDKSGALWGVSAHNVYSLAVQGSTVHCASSTALSLGTGVQLGGLSLAPAGVLDPTNEVLVGADTVGSLWGINVTTGMLTQHGTLGLVPTTDGHGHSYANAGKTWELSGDIVFLANGGNPVGYATVRDCPTPPSTTGCDTTDTLISVNMNGLATATTNSVLLQVIGQVVKAAGCSDSAAGYGRLSGIAAWQGSVFGFARSVGVVQISEVDGTGCSLQPTSILWGGAGITTLAPP
jgi:hypothetical protein